MTTIGIIAEAVKRGYTVTFEPHGDGVAMHATKGDIHRAISCDLEGVKMSLVISKLPLIWTEQVDRK